MDNQLQIIPSNLLFNYCKSVPEDLKLSFDSLKDADLSSENFDFYISVSSVFSSKIEGEQIELDSYVKHKKFGVEFSPDYTKKIDDLYNAYVFAKENEINLENLSKAHQLLSKHLVADNWHGKYRKQNMYVTTQDGKIEYVAALPNQVDDEMTKLFGDIEFLIKSQLTFQEVFYFASFIHLVFVKIHPWNDGNGRTARLLEKWFLAQKLGQNAWFIQSEKLYYQNYDLYYNNIRLLGLEYAELAYSKSLKFLLMLPSALTTF